MKYKPVNHDIPHPYDVRRRNEVIAVKQAHNERALVAARASGEPLELGRYARAAGTASSPNLPRDGTVLAPQTRQQAAFNRFISTAERESRDMSATTGSQGGYLIPPGYDAELLMSQRYASAWGKARLIETPLYGGPINTPTLFGDQSSIAAKQTENAAQTEADLGPPGFGVINWPQATIWRMAGTNGLMRWSANLEADSGLSMSEIIRDAAAARLQRAYDAEATAVATAGLTSTYVTAANTGITLADLTGLWYSVDAAYRTAPGSAFIVSPNTEKALRSLVTTSGDPVLREPMLSIVGSSAQFDVDDAQDIALRAPTFWGVPVLSSRAVADFVAGGVCGFFGDVHAAIAHRYVSTEILIAKERWADYNELQAIGFARFDVKITGDQAAMTVLTAHA
jgi:HK97 family phage major capsid protein